MTARDRVRTGWQDMLSDLLDQVVALAEERTHVERDLEASKGKLIALRAAEDVSQVQKNALVESQKKLASEIERLNTRLQEKKTELLDEALILVDTGERTAPLRPWDRIEAAERQRRAAERQL